MSGDKKAGFTIFWADDGLDTGPVLLQRECDVKANDTLDELYNRFLYPEGIKAMVWMVSMVAFCASFIENLFFLQIFFASLALQLLTSKQRECSHQVLEHELSTFKGKGVKW